MKILRAKFENFRLLKDVEFSFSIDASKNLTVIRASNESGKTTILNGLQWGLFGDIGLPTGGKFYRLHPTDSSTEPGTQVKICVEIEYQIEGRVAPRQYRLIRSATEDLDGNEWKRHSESVRLFELTSTGADPIDHAEAHIRPHLPNELREVFFTDGDRALSFIEGARTDQMRRVEAAIRSLLGLSVVEDAIRHVTQVGKTINKKVKNDSGSELNLDEISTRIDAISTELPTLEEEKELLEGEVRNCEELERDADNSLTDALRKGNREELASDLEDTRRRWKLAGEAVRKATRDQTNLFKSQLLARTLLKDTLGQSKSILDKLHDQHKIPNQTIPVLEEQLQHAVCICGEGLDKGSPDGIRRRDAIQQLIDGSRSSDKIQERVTALYYSSKELLSPLDDEGWRLEYAEVFGRRQEAAKLLSDLGGRQRELENRIASLPSVDIQQLRESRERYKAQKADKQREAAILHARISQLRQELENKKKEQEGLLKNSDKGQRLLAELTVSQDLLEVLDSSLDKMKTRELQEVSAMMNEFFLEMIGADPDQSSVIRHAEITPEFRIVVRGQQDRELDPSQDLNGASRRALTIAFILAVTKVSQVEAPNVIDTPLGMMDGHVKRAVLQKVSKESAQPILLLTRSEILECEDIIDTYAGRVYTLTNAAHHPRFLVNPPPVSDNRVLICACDHRSHCSICERRTAEIAN